MPYHKIFLKHLVQADKIGDRFDESTQQSNVQGFKLNNVNREDVLLEFEIAIIKKL